MQHRLRLTGPPQAAAEIACLRIIAQLPPRWTAEILESGIGYAVLGLRTDFPATEVTATVDAALASAPLRGWKRS